MVILDHLITRSRRAMAGKAGKASKAGDICWPSFEAPMEIADYRTLLSGLFIFLLLIADSY